MEVFSEFVSKKPRAHIGETVDSKIKPDNTRRTIQDEDNFKNRALYSIKLGNSEEIVLKKSKKLIVMLSS
jgi:hypothetical protein